MEENKLTPQQDKNISVLNSKVEWIKLGEVIRQCDERNTNGSYTKEDVRGVSIEKKIIPTKANMDGVSVGNYKLFPHNAFCFVPVTSRNGNKITLALNQDEKTYIVSSAYEVFKVKDTSILNPDFLFLIFCRPEFDRYARFNSWGSARESFSYESMENVAIPLPSLSEQRKVVNAWKALREIKEQNEAKAKPLMQVCQSYIQELKHKYDSVEIGEFIEECNERNVENTYGESFLRGVTSDGIFDHSKAKTQGLSFGNYKIVSKENFAYNPSRINIGSIAVSEEQKCIISPMYIVFKVVKKSLLPDFLSLWFRRKEFQRSTLFYASGSVRDTFGFQEMKNVKIPLPPISVQQAIVNIYNCANEAKRIAEEADRMSREICPALIQHIINN
ncbi:MAG: restriction endonuclease subunit S [Prevotella sp.]|nr:restriction endonuclease subunit S [Prevotella sp.]